MQPYALELIRRIWARYYAQTEYEGQPMTMIMCVSLARHITAEYGEEL